MKTKISGGDFILLIKKLSNSSVKIVIDDIELLGLSFENINKNDSRTKDMISGILKKIYNDTGMNFMESKLFVETFLSKNGKSCVIYISVIDEEDYDMTEPYYYAIEFENLQNFISFAESIRRESEFALSQSNLYSYNGKLILTVMVMSDYEERVLISATEFGKIMGYGELCNSYAEEHFECIIKDFSI